MDFSNKTVIVTGGTRGIGASIVNSFCDAGATVLLSGTGKLTPGFKKHISNELVSYHQLDFLSEESVKNFTGLIKKIDNIDVLINNAGVNKINNLSNISSDDWNWLNTINLKGPFLLTQVVSESMKKNRSGKIINVSSIFSVVSRVKRSAYSASKWGLVGFTKAVALELAPYNIQVNAISPGFVNTSLTRKIIGEKNIEQLEKSIPQKRLAEPDEIADVVLFLSSDYNTYLTGQNIVVDGGYTSA